MASLSASPAPRSVTRRRPLPGSRAVVGGLLVAASAVGLFAAYGSANRPPAASYVVVDRLVAEGHVLRAGDLDVVPLDLPADQRRMTFSAIGPLVGTVATVALRPGQLVQRSLVAPADEGPPRAQISVPVEAGNAFDGQGLVGEEVDVVVSFDSAGDVVAETVARGVVVDDVLRDDDGLGPSGELVVVLDVDPDDVEAIARASAAGTITLVRT